ncbi:MAG: hypothetical protein LBS94_04565, partial [Prevotellaceae bacterium]|nr:hypothetical protein [Prevotellaceae bacterium]
MANLRKIKKDIDFLVEEVMADCCLFVEFHPTEKEEEVGRILLDAVNLRNELIERVNAKPDKGCKGHYTAIAKDLLEGADKLFSRV